MPDPVMQRMSSEMMDEAAQIIDHQKVRLDQATNLFERLLDYEQDEQNSKELSDEIRSWLRNHDPVIQFPKREK